MGTRTLTAAVPRIVRAQPRTQTGMGEAPRRAPAKARATQTPTVAAPRRTAREARAIQMPMVEPPPGPTARARLTPIPMVEPPPGPTGRARTTPAHPAQPPTLRHITRQHPIIRPRQPMRTILRPLSRITDPAATTAAAGLAQRGPLRQVSW